MGGDSSKPAQILSEPWKDINWEYNRRELEFLKNYKPQTEGQQLRILLYGPVGAGKSSFINSVQSVLHDRMYVQALANNIAHVSLTKKYTTYKIQKDRPNTFYPFVFNNSKGLDPHKGVLVEDVKLALKGHVKDGYTFNPVSQITENDPFYNRSPTSNDKVQVLVLVISAVTLLCLSDTIVKEVHEIRAAASHLEIPQVAILTNIDRGCPEVQKDIRNVYKLKYMKEKMEKLSVEIGIPMNCIFPVKNYHEEISLDSDTDSLILSAMRHIVTCGEDHIRFKQSQSARSDTA